MTHQQPRQTTERRGFRWAPRTRMGKVALGLDIAMLAFPLWVLPSWYLVTFLIGAGGMFESPRAIAANSVFQGILVVCALLVNLVALLGARDHSFFLVVALGLLTAVLVYMGWYTAEFGFPGSESR